MPVSGRDFPIICSVDLWQTGDRCQTVDNSSADWMRNQQPTIDRYCKIVLVGILFGKELVIGMLISFLNGIGFDR